MRLVAALAIPFAAALLLACGSDATCVPGEQIACACPVFGQGTQVCAFDGSAYSACSCLNPTPTGGGATFPVGVTSSSAASSSSSAAAGGGGGGAAASSAASGGGGGASSASAGP